MKNRILIKRIFTGLLTASLVMSDPLMAMASPYDSGETDGISEEELFISEEEDEPGSEPDEVTDVDDPVTEISVPDMVEPENIYSDGDSGDFTTDGEDADYQVNTAEFPAGFGILDVTDYASLYEETDLEGSYPLDLSNSFSTETGAYNSVYSSGDTANITHVPISISSSISSSRKPVSSYCATCANVITFLYQDSYIGVAYPNGNNVAVQIYSANGVLIKTLSLPLRLSMFGGITSDDDGNFYVFSGKNDSSASNIVTVSITKYDSTGLQTATLDLKGKDARPQMAPYSNGYIYNLYDEGFGTKFPFDAGNCSMTVNDGIVAVNYGREMYNGHQSNMVIYADCETMERLYGDTAYTSHSFDQRIVPSGDGFIALNHGDAYYRGFSITTLARTNADPDDDRYYGQLYDEDTFYTFHFREGANRSYGYNETFAQLGGIAKLYDGFVFAGASERTLSAVPGPTSGYLGHNESRDLFIQILSNTFYQEDNVEDKYLVPGTTRTVTGTRPASSKTDLFLQGDETDYGVIWLTNYNDNKSYAANPKVYAITDSLFGVLWEKRSYNDSTVSTWFSIMDMNGDVIKGPKKVPNTLLASDCDPVVINGCAYWAVKDSTGSFLHILSPSDISITKQPYISDISENTDGTYDLTLTVEASGVSAYSWEKSDDGDTWDEVNSELVSGSSDSDTIVINPAGDNTLYRCVMEDEFGYSVTSNVVTGIITEPENIYAAVGESVPLLVRAIGVAALNWQISGKNNTWNDISGADQFNYEYVVSAEDYGRKIRCAITGYDGETIYTTPISINKISYYLRLYQNAGTGAYYDHTIAADESVRLSSIVPKEMKRDGYTIDRFTANQDGTGTTYAADDSVSNLTDELWGVVPLYIQWGYPVTLDPCGGTCAVKSIPVAMGKTYSFKVALPGADKTGMIFDGWYTAASGGIHVTDNTIVSSHDKHTLYTHWKPIKYTVRFDANFTGSDQDMTDMSSLDYGEEYELTENGFLREGYLFAGWNTEPDGSGSTYADKTIVSDLTTVDNDIVTLYAQWNPVVYHVVFDGNGQVNAGVSDVVGTMSAIDLTYDQISYLPPNRYTRKGYYFAYWSTVGEGLGDRYSNKAGVLNLSSEDGSTVTLYAHWEQSAVPDPYAKLSSPGISEDGKKVYPSGTRVYLLCDLAGAQIYVKINDGEETLYTDSIKLDPCIADESGDYLKVKLTYVAKKTGYIDSEPVTEIYYIPNESPWGDLEDTGNEDVKELYPNPDNIPSGLWLYGIENKTYTGTALTQPSLKVFFGKKELKEGTEYTVKYSNNINAGTATVTVTGKGNFTGTMSRSFKIATVSLGTVNGEDITNSADLDAPDIALAYNGRIQKGTTTVTYHLKQADESYKDITLKAGTDFTYVYPNTNFREDDYEPTAFVGMAAAADTTGEQGFEEYTVTIEGKGNYTGTATFTERIYAKDAENVTLISKLKISAIPAQTLTYGRFNEDTQTWTADDTSDTIMPCMPVLTITKSGETVNADQYLVRYKNNTAPGTATAIITGQGNIVGTRVVTFKINARSMSAVSVDGLASPAQPDLVFTGTEVYLCADNSLTDELDGYRLRYKVSRSVPEGISTLKEGRDYKVTYSDNTKAGRAAVTYTGMGIYAGSIRKTFTISSCSLRSIPGVITSGGSISMKVEGVEVTAATTPEDISMPYVKGGVKPKVELIFTNTEDHEYKLVEGTDYTLKYTNNSKVTDNAQMTITFKGSFRGRKALSFVITPSTLNDVTITAADVKTAKTAGCRTTVTITDSNGTRLAPGTDYDKTFTYTYEYDTDVIDKNTGDRKRIPAGTDVDMNNDIISGYTEDNPSVIRVTVTGKGNYEGTEVSTTFKVLASNMDISRATVKVNDKPYTGKPIEVTKNDLTVTLNKVEVDGADYRIVPGSFENNINKGTAKFVIEGVGEYGGSRTVTFKIVSRSADFTVTYDNNLTYMTGVFEDAPIDTEPVISGTVKPGKVAEGRTLARNNYKLPGFSFAGWNTEPDGTGVMYASGGRFAPYDAVTEDVYEYGGDVTFYAQWIPVEYKLTYKTNGGVNDQYTPMTYNILAGVVLSEPVRDGYSFAGWFFDSRCKTKPLDPENISEGRSGAYIIPAGTTGNKTVYASWIKLEIPDPGPETMSARNRILDLARSWLGKNEADESHKEIIDIYNSHRPLARGYEVKYTDSWCAVFVSALSIACGLTDYMPTECSCGRMIELYQNINKWVEKDNYAPTKGDLIFYDWDDDGNGDNEGWPEHVGIVESVSGGILTVIEGNYSDMVKRRQIEINGKCIRGFATPDYEAADE